MRLLYSFSVNLYTFAIRVASLFNHKAKLWISGRKNIFTTIQTNKKSTADETIWVHCASLGEFEQGRPLIEMLKKKKPSTYIVLTFFSPSGYEIRKNYPFADAVYYLPADTQSNAKQFINSVKPDRVFFIKYEFWFNCLNELKKQQIPTYLISGIFRQNHYFFKGYGGWFRSHLNCFTHCYLQNTESEKLLNDSGYFNTTTTGDTRFDRVAEIALHVKSFPLIDVFKQNEKVIIAGSTWAPDEALLAQLSSSSTKLIIAPHEVNQAHIQAIKDLFQNANYRVVCYSEANENNISTATILIIDSIGILSSLYQYGDIAYIGGGFGKGIHNTLEAATFGLPVIFGPNYHKFSEAIDLIKLGGGFSVSTKTELQNQLDRLTNNQNTYTKAANSAKNYIDTHKGATEKIINSIWKSN
jgi:3-deoxy-D-manno-octulosonic-acid transferase